jgi:large conductance mechanosensitive channel
MEPFHKLAALEPRKRAFSLFEEFRNFAFKGNVVDLAVGVIIGAAFGNIVKSLVENLIMPLIGVKPGEGGYKNLVWEFAGREVPYGKFIGDILYFLIVAFVLFIFIVKFLGWIMKSKKEAPPPPLTKDQELLTEIRDLLKSQRPEPKAGGEVGAS